MNYYYNIPKCEMVEVSRLQAITFKSQWVCTTSGSKLGIVMMQICNSSLKYRSGLCRDSQLASRICCFTHILQQWWIKWSPLFAGICNSLKTPTNTLWTLWKKSQSGDVLIEENGVCQQVWEVIGCMGGRYVLGIEKIGFFWKLTRYRYTITWHRNLGVGSHLQSSWRIQRALWETVW